MDIQIRVATISDIPQMQAVRRAVTENRLSDPDLVKDEDYVDYLVSRGRGWVATCGNGVVGFAIADLIHKSVWALFLLPQFEGKGIGRSLHDEMLEWYFGQAENFIFLTTAINTRADQFYSLKGWRDAGMHSKIERRFEMTRDEWMSGKSAQ
jgi:GNAT superfamily N-acetyltransferase